MDKEKGSMKMPPRHEREGIEVQYGHTTPGAAEGDLETIEQDLAQKDQGGPQP